MFVFLAVLSLFSLLSFGAVRPTETYVVQIAEISAFTILVATDVFRGRRLNLFFILFTGGVLLLMSATAVKMGLGLFAAGWSWEAARRNIGSAQKFFYFLFCIGLLEASLGLFQYFVAPGWMPGYQNTSSISSGTLINRNHFAGVLEMIIPVSIGLAYSASHLRQGIARAYLLLLGGVFMAFALVFSLSRTGIVSLLLTLSFMVVTVRTRIPQRRFAVMLATVFVGLLASGTLWIGMNNVLARYGELLDRDAVSRAGRLNLAIDTVKMIKANPMGIGAGKYQDVFRRYQTFHSESLFEHAHNDYLETTAEWSIPVSLIFWSGVALILMLAVRAFASERASEQRGVLLACAGAIVAILIHSVTDFNLQIPSNAILFFSFLGIGLAMSPSPLGSG